MSKLTIKCKLCGDTAEEIDFCYGCQSYICEGCNTYPDTPGGKHRPIAHLELSKALAALAELQKRVDDIVNNT